MVGNEGDGAQLSQTTQLGPNGLVMVHNDKVEPLTVRDIFETLRWMRDDLRTIKSEFKHVYGMKSEMEKIKGIHAKQGMMYRQYVSRISDLAGKLSDQTNIMATQILSQTKEIEMQKPMTLS